MNGSILLVDDNPAFLDSTKDLLEIEGYQVFPVSSSKQAMEMAVEREFDMILMDIKMPGKNGVECFLEIKKHRPKARVILMTAYSLEDLVRDALREGVLAVLPKPLNIERLLMLIRRQRENGRGGLILLADDDRLFCANLSEVLAARGYEVVTAFDSDMVLDQVACIQFDILLLDMRFPVLDGLEVYRRVKAIQPNLVTILISGYTTEMHDMIQQALTEKAQCFLSKPLDIDNLIDVLRESFTLRDRYMTSKESL